MDPAHSCPSHETSKMPRAYRPDTSMRPRWKSTGPVELLLKKLPLPKFVSGVQTVKRNITLEESPEIILALVVRFSWVGSCIHTARTSSRLHYPGRRILVHGVPGDCEQLEYGRVTSCCQSSEESPISIEGCGIIWAQRLIERKVVWAKWNGDLVTIR